MAKGDAGKGKGSKGGKGRGKGSSKSGKGKPHIGKATDMKTKKPVKIVKWGPKENP